MTLQRRPLLALAGLGLLASQNLALAADAASAPSGNLAQRRDVGSFTAVAVGGPFEVTLRPAERESVELRGDSDLLARVETTIKTAGGERTLNVDLKRSLMTRIRTPITVDIGYVRLDGISLGGDGRIRGDGLRSKKLDVAIGGSGTIQLRALDADALEVAIGGSGGFESDGRARSLEISIGGSGSFDGPRLTADDVEVSIGGSGNVRVRAEKTLKASIAGSGSVVYDGKATATSSIAGSGRVRKAS